MREESALKKIAQIISIFMSHLYLFRCVFLSKPILHYQIGRFNGCRRGSLDKRGDWFFGYFQYQKTFNVAHIHRVDGQLKFRHLSLNYFDFSLCFLVWGSLLRCACFLKNYVKIFNSISSFERDLDSRIIEEICWKILMRLMRTKILISVDDYRHTHPLTTACNSLGITSISYQHAAFSGLTAGIEQAKFDYSVVWSEFFKKVHERELGRKPSKVIVVGYPFRRQTQMRLKNNRPQDVIKILWIGENAELDRFEGFVKHLSQCEGCILLFKEKPGLVRSHEPLGKFGISRVVLNEPFFDVLATEKIDVVIGSRSTSLLESWLVGVPSVGLDIGDKYGQELLTKADIPIANDEFQLENLVLKSLKINLEQTRRKADAIWGSQTNSKNLNYNREFLESLLNVKRDC